MKDGIKLLARNSITLPLHLTFQPIATGSYNILARWSDYFSQLLNVHGVHDVRQTETHTAEPLVPEPRVFEVELAIEKLNRLSTKL